MRREIRYEGEETCCPECGSLIVEEIIYRDRIRNTLEKCPRCGWYRKENPYETGTTGHDYDMERKQSDYCLSPLICNECGESFGTAGECPFCGSLNIRPLETSEETDF